MIDFIYKKNSVAIDTDFIENKMQNINGEFVKVYLYAVFAKENNIDIKYSSIAQKLGLLESEVIKAFDIFFDMGIFKRKEKAKKEPENKGTNEEMSEFCIIAEATANRPLTAREIDTLYWIYNNLSLQPEVILMAIEYCIGEGKDNIYAVEQLCVKWDKEEINTIPKANKFLEEQYKRKDIITKFLKKLNAENDEQMESFILSWYFDMNIEEDVIEYAFLCCKNQINEINPSYINTILRNWQKANIKTLQDAKEYNKKFRKKYKKTNEVSGDDGEYDDLAFLTQG